MTRLLHLGCGQKGHAFPTPDVEEITLDADASNKPDIVCCLGRDTIPLPDDSIDGALAVHVLEHIGRVGETSEWFQFWEELYRVLKPEGKLEFVAPWWESVWAWADPSHVRPLSPEAFYFLRQANYLIPDAPISPYHIRCDFVPSGPIIKIAGAVPAIIEAPSMNASAPTIAFRGTLIAQKPLQPWWEHSS